MIVKERTCERGTKRHEIIDKTIYLEFSSQLFAGRCLLLLFLWLWTSRVWTLQRCFFHGI